MKEEDRKEFLSVFVGGRSGEDGWVCHVHVCVLELIVDYCLVVCS